MLTAFALNFRFCLKLLRRQLNINQKTLSSQPASILKLLNAFSAWMFFSLQAHSAHIEFHTRIPTNVAASTVILRCFSCCCRSCERSKRRVHPRIKPTRKFHSVSSGIVQPSAAATPSARTSPEFQAVIVQTQFLYACIKDCVWTSLLGMNVNVRGRGRKPVTVFDVPFAPYLVFRK